MADDARRARQLVHDPAGDARGGLLHPPAQLRQLERGALEPQREGQRRRSRAAEEDSPAPTGRSVVTVPTNPLLGRSSADDAGDVAGPTAARPSVGSVDVERDDGLGA